MARLGELDRGVRQITAALVTGDEIRRLSDIAVKLADRIAGTRGFDLRPYLVGLSTLVVEILEDQIVFRAEMAVERHLVGAGRLRDRFDPDAADAMAVKEILRAGDDSFARRLLSVAERLLAGLAALAF